MVTLGDFAEPWLRRDGESREKVTNQPEATINTEAAVEMARVNEHFRTEIPL